MKIKTRKIVFSALIGALYVVVTVLLAPISYGPVQVRLSESLTVLPFLFPEAIPGLFFGCMVANIYGGFGPIDIFGGSFLTLIAALLTYWLRRFKKPWLAPLPPVVINALGVSLYLHILSGLPYWVTVGYIAIGQVVSCYVVGLILLYALQRKQGNFF